jgi:DNA-binding PadR family transcriptional regulator
MLANAILAVLEDGPLHGYAIRRALAQRIGLLWPVNQGQVYSTLRRLARDRHVAAVAPAPGPPARSSRALARSYGLTAIGRRRLAEWLRRPAGLDDARDELAHKLAVAADLGDRARLRALVAAQRRTCADLLATMRVGLAVGERAASAAAASPARDDSRRARTTTLALVDAEVAWLTRLLDALDDGAPARDT